MSNWLLAKPERLLWAALWVQVVVAVALATMGTVAVANIGLVPVIYLMIRARRAGLF